jgi:hypothetical protein
LKLQNFKKSESHKSRCPFAFGQDGHRLRVPIWLLQATTGHDIAMPLKTKIASLYREGKDWIGGANETKINRNWRLVLYPKSLGKT